MLTNQPLSIGNRVTFKMYVKPFDVVSGVIVESKPDIDRKKPAKYSIKPDKPRKEFNGKNPQRYHPVMIINPKNESEWIVADFDSESVENIIDVV